MKLFQLCTVLVLYTAIASCNQSSAVENENAVLQEADDEMKSERQVYNDGDERQTFKLPDSSVVDLDRDSHCTYWENIKNDLRMDYGQFYFSVKPKRGDTLRIHHDSLDLRVSSDAEFNVKLIATKSKARVTVYKGTVYHFVDSCYAFQIVEGKSTWIFPTAMGVNRPANPIDSTWRHLSKYARDLEEL